MLRVGGFEAGFSSVCLMEMKKVCSEKMHELMDSRVNCKDREDVKNLVSYAIGVTNS